MVAILENIGLLADCATNGATAVELAGRGAYALILMDLQMPIMDGFEATRRIRQQPKHAQVPILALTGNVVKEVQDRCRAAGMNDFIAKPSEWRRCSKSSGAGCDRRPAHAELQSAAAPAGDSSLAASVCHMLRGHRIARVLPCPGTLCICTCP